MFKKKKEEVQNNPDYVAIVKNDIAYEKQVKFEKDIKEFVRWLLEGISAGQRVVEKCQGEINEKNKVLTHLTEDPEKFYNEKCQIENIFEQDNQWRKFKESQSGLYHVNDLKTDVYSFGK